MIREKTRRKMSKQEDLTGFEIAIIGMAGRFLAAKNIEEFWENLVAGKETISFFNDEELLETGVNPGILAEPNYVKAYEILEDIEYFDSSFAAYTPQTGRKSLQYNTAACLSGVFSLQDVLKLALQRGEMMLGMPVGSMMSVSLMELNPMRGL
jgi:acyl transferase domain-containing protein